LLDTAHKTLIVCACGWLKLQRINLGDLKSHWQLEMWPKSCISVAISWPQFCPNHLCLRWPLPAWPGPIENTFYTITNCNEIDLSRTTARRSRNPHKFWHTRSEMEAGRVGFWCFWPGRQFATVFGPLRPQFTYILGLLLDGHISPRFSLAGYPALAFYLTLLSTWIMRIALWHKHHSSSSYEFVCPAWCTFYYQQH